MTISQAMSSNIGDVDPFLDHPLDEVFATKHAPDANVQEKAEYEFEEDLTIEELETRIWRDRMLLKKLKEERKDKEKRQSLEQLKRKTMSRAQDGILRYMPIMQKYLSFAHSYAYSLHISIK